MPSGEPDEQRPPIIAVTMGDPAGIGAEVIAKTWPVEGIRALVVGDASVLEEAIRRTRSGVTVNTIAAVADASFEPGSIDLMDLDNVAEHVYGTVRGEYGRASLDYIETALELTLEGDVDGIVTAPIHKRAIRRAGSDFAGHTELLAARTGTEHYAMLLVESNLRVAHVSTHLPLAEAIDRVTTDRVYRTIGLTADALQDLRIDSPTIAVSGLNPHASEGGLFGHTEAQSIRPAVERAIDAGVDAVGPESPDTVFARAASGDFDAVVAMYHDQGHIPVKMLGHTKGSAISGVNVTIGLPIVRTSVDHGTAFDIAGEGIADPTSMEEAIVLAGTLSRMR